MHCASWVDGLWLTSDESESRTECVKTWSSYDNVWKAVGSRLLLCVVRKRIYRRRPSGDVDIGIYFHEWCAAQMSARESKGPLPAYEQHCTSCTCVCWLYVWPEGPTPAG